MAGSSVDDLLEMERPSVGDKDGDNESWNQWKMMNKFFDLANTILEKQANNICLRVASPNLLMSADIDVVAPGLAKALQVGLKAASMEPLTQLAEYLNEEEE
jgi:hypothetical protein